MIEKVTIIGSGNIAHWMTYAMRKVGILIPQVYSRTLEHATALAEKCDAEAICRLSDLKPLSDLYLFAVKDDCFDELLPQLPFKLPLAAHTGGSMSIHILENYAENFGIIYPYQSLSKNMDFAGVVVPLSVEGNVKQAEEDLMTLAMKLSNLVSYMDEKQRFVLHRAAIFGCNFTNAMYHIAYDILKKNDIDWQMIIPLLQNTLDKVKVMTPKEAQTGPAKRRDSNVIEMHQSSLSDPRVREIYHLMTEYIIRNDQ